MNYTVKRGWQAWSVDSIYGTGSYVGGYAIKYANNFTFATVRGAGHMVPETRAEASFAMLQRHITGKGF
jgi:serine carboxypeptidase-like clade I